VRRRDRYDDGPDWADQVGRDFRGDPDDRGRSSRLTRPLRRPKRRRRAWADRRPTKRPRWASAPVDRDTVLSWARHSREQEARAATWARSFIKQLEWEERGRDSPSLRLLRARSLVPRELRRRVGWHRCALLCGELRGPGRSPYCAACRRLHVAELHRIREARRRARSRG